MIQLLYPNIEHRLFKFNENLFILIMKGFHYNDLWYIMMINICDIYNFKYTYVLYSFINVLYIIYLV